MKQVDDKSIILLREQEMISETEVAYVRGDLLVAVNVLTEEKRVIGKANELLTESPNRRVLKG